MTIMNEIQNSPTELSPISIQLSKLTGWRTRVYLWRIHVDIWQYQYNIVKLKNKIKYEKKRRLLLGRKVIINLDSILKSRDITLPTKVRLVKAMVFPVVMYGCYIWTVKKAEH